MRRFAFVGHGSGLLLLVLLTLAASAQWVPPASAVPAFHTDAPRKAAPPLLPEGERTGMYFVHRYQKTAYSMADAVPDVIYQQPCYCWCSKAMGHKSLHSCFEDSHGATCSVCMQEAAYAFTQTRLGKTPAEIRAGIVKGDWRAVDLLKLQLGDAPAAPSAGSY